MTDFEIKKQILKTPQQAYSELLGSSAENQIIDIPIDLIDEINDQPFKIKEENVRKIAESMKQVGQIEPAIVIPSSKIEGRYDLLAGRHRRRAALLNGEPTLKSIIKKENNFDKQRLILLISNNDRNNDYLPSELAFSYKEQMELLQKLGSTKTTTIIAEENNTNRKSVHKYIQLTNLDKGLLNRVDNGELTVGAGYELSFLSPEKQRFISLQFFNYSNLHITQDQAKRIRKNPEDIKDILLIGNLSNKDTEPEVKVVSNEKTSKTMSLEGTTKTKKEVPKEVLTLISEILYRETYSIFKYVVTEFASTTNAIEFIVIRYANKDVKLTGKCIQYKSPIYSDYGYILTFKKNYLNVTLTNREKGNEKYKISYNLLDVSIRKYLTTIPIEEILSILKENSNGNN